MTGRILMPFYGLKFNAFLAAVPVEDLREPPAGMSVLLRVETLAMAGGFGLLTGSLPPLFRRPSRARPDVVRRAEHERVVPSVPQTAARPAGTVGEV